MTTALSACASCFHSSAVLTLSPPRSSYKYKQEVFPEDTFSAERSLDAVFLWLVKLLKSSVRAPNAKMVKEGPALLSTLIGWTRDNVKVNQSEAD